MSLLFFLLLKLVSAIFYQIFIFSPNDSPLKTIKCFLFHQKSSFRSRDMRIFVIFSLPQFPDSKGQMEVEYIMMSSIDLHKFTDAILGITQKLFIIT